MSHSFVNRHHSFLTSKFRPLMWGLVMYQTASFTSHTSVSFLNRERFVYAVTETELSLTRNMAWPIKFMLPQGVVTCMSPVGAFNLRPRSISKMCAWFLDCSLLWLLIAWFPRIKGQIAATHSWWLIFSSSEVTLIPWSDPQKGFDRLIQFCSWSLVLLV